MSIHLPETRAISKLLYLEFEFKVIVFIILILVCCVYSLESPHRGDSNENTQYIPSC